MMLKCLNAKILFLFAVIFSSVCFVSCNKCTNVLGKTDIREVVVKEPCIQKYTARCAWLSLSYCTFYHNTYCDKKVNETVKTYYIKTDCCKGFMMARNGSCIKKRPGVEYPPRTTPTSVFTKSPVNPNYVEPPDVDKQKVDQVKMEISGGGYAGIACGLILFVSIVAFIIIAVRKRKHKKQQLEARQAEKVLYIGPTAGNQPIVRNLGNSRTPSVQISREATPSSSKMVTPPTSPVKTVLPVEEPLMNHTVNTDDIPESDV